MRRYTICKSSDGRYAFTFEKWGFYNITWSGRTQVVVSDPNDRSVITFPSLDDARKRAEEVCIDDSITWERV